MVLITIFGPLSGAHFNPAVTLVFAVRREIGWALAGAYILAQLVGGIAGVWTAHAMFAEPIVQVSTKLRDWPAQGFAEFVATYRDPTFVASLAESPGPRHLGEDFEMVADTFHRFAAEKVRPHAEHVHRANADIPESVIAGLAELGML